MGRSKSIVADSYAMCALDGSEYVGGISGQGKRVVSCSSIVEMDESIACSGAICGWADGEDEDLFIYHNSFVSDTLGGVDGISYDEAAEPVSYRELYAMENLPERFRSLRVTFRAEEDGETAIEATAVCGPDWKKPETVKFVMDMGYSTIDAVCNTEYDDRDGFRSDMMMTLYGKTAE